MGTKFYVVVKFLLDYDIPNELEVIPILVTRSKKLAKRSLPKYDFSNDNCYHLVEFDEKPYFINTLVDYDYEDLGCDPVSVENLSAKISDAVRYWLREGLHLPKFGNFFLEEHSLDETIEFLKQHDLKDLDLGFHSNNTSVSFENYTEITQRFDYLENVPVTVCLEMQLLMWRKSVEMTAHRLGVQRKAVIS